MRVGGPIRPHSGVLAHSGAAQGAKYLIRWQTQANLLPDRRPLGECRFLLALKLRRIKPFEGSIV